MNSADASEQTEPTDIWDAVVIGAGPAGAVVSCVLAREGVRTRLLDAKPLGRQKVCGGCLNARAIMALQAVGMGKLLQHCHPAPLNRLAIYYAGRSAHIPLPDGISITRSTLDAHLVGSAVEAGADFVPGTTCRVLPNNNSNYRLVRLTSANGNVSTVAARVVLACDGLGHPSLTDLPEFMSTVSPHSRIGLGTTLSGSQVHTYIPPKTICMAVSWDGYVGLARAESDQLSIAAAVDPASLAAARSPTHLIQQILQTAGIDNLSLGDDVHFRGTPPITQSTATVAADRVFLVGDAAGYVEPFTGEGMAAAIEGATAVAPLALKALAGWTPSLEQAWQSVYAKRIRARQLASRSIAWLVRHPRLLRWSLASVSRQPQVGAAVARWIGLTPASTGTAHR